MAQAIFTEVAAMAERYGVERLVFGTLTFPTRVTSHKQAQARWHSLRTHVFAPRYPQAVVVFERHASGAIHLHFVAVASADVRTGFDFVAFEAAKAAPRGGGAFWRWVRRYGESASPALRDEWEFWRRVAPRYRFGRTEIAPVRVDAQAVARYLASYLTKPSNVKAEGEGRQKLVRFVGFGPRKVQRRLYGSGWSWSTAGGRLSRVLMKWAATDAGFRDLEHAKEELGPRWARTLSLIGEKAPEWVVPPDLRERWREDKRKRQEKEHKTRLDNLPPSGAP